VPKDLAVIAFTDGIISKFYSTIYRESKRQKMETKRQKMLIDRLEENIWRRRRSKIIRQVIETHLIERNPLIDALVVNPIISIQQTFFWLTIKTENEILLPKII
jgi:LacI family transcriptional regulator